MVTVGGDIWRTIRNCWMGIASRKRRKAAYSALTLKQDQLRCEILEPKMSKFLVLFFIVTVFSAAASVKEMGRKQKKMDHFHFWLKGREHFRWHQSTSVENLGSPIWYLPGRAQICSSERDYSPEDGWVLLLH
ncbi:hypothetical protein AVEN_238687-1 [Araneus ventricosus]|uniref:Uncharacterized protein n=1 Tax=Araneus ventricosus TaxID=182803 RepID=A0A4Y2BYX1_ARAVE|nr:hypothetical protein AVEN_238687-1 [Araneus ventricosus]